MDFRKSFPVVSSFNKKNRFSNSQRSLQIESLESREMLAVSILSGAITGYAGTSNTAEIRFDIATDNGGMSKIDFVVQGYNGLDPAQLTLYNHTTQKTVSLTNIVNGTTSSSASAIMGAGTYSIYVAADKGDGSFSLDVLHDNKYVYGDSALEILVAAAIAEQQSGWANRKDYYNKLLSQYPGFGAKALDGGRVRDLYPQVDVNGDGKVDALDYQAAQVLSSGTVTTPSLTTTPKVINQDKTGPTITASLKNDTGTVGDLISIDTTIVGQITDASGIKSAQYRLDNGSWVSVSLDANGNYTIANQQLTAGSHTITIRATDSVGNESTGSISFVYPASVSPAFPSTTNLVEGGSTVVSPGIGFIVQKINGTAVQSGNTVNLPNNRGSVTYNANGSLTFQAGSYFDSLPAGKTETYSFSVVTTDSHGRQFSSDLVFVITGKNNLPTLVNTTPVQGPTVNEGSSGQVSLATIRALWNDVDSGTSLSIANGSLFVSGISYSNTSVRYNTADIVYLLSANSNGITLNADAEFFKKLGSGESIVITVGYKVFDGVENSAVNGYLTFTIKGVDNPSVLKTNQTAFSGVSNDLNNPVKSFNPGFTVSDSDLKDASGFVYFVVNATDQSGRNVAGLVNINQSNGSFSVNTAGLADRNTNSTLTLKIGVRSVSGGEVFETITVNLSALGNPSASNSFTLLETESKSQKLAPTVPGKSGYSISGLKLQTGSTLPAGASLQNIAQIDSQGNFQFTSGTYFEYLSEGETKSIVLEYTIQDNEFGLIGKGTITLVIQGVSTLPTAPTSTDPVGKNGTINVTEGTGGTPNKTVSKNDLLANWNLPEGLNKYDIVNVSSPSFGGWFDGSVNSTVNPFAGSGLGSATVDANGNIVFTPNENLYDKLGAGQWIDVAINYSVKNKDVSGIVEGGQVVIRVYGQNTNPTLAVNQDVFVLPNNPASNISNIGAIFTPNDVDLNNNGVFRYELSGNNYGFVIDSATGTISITKEAAAKLATGDHTLQVKLIDAHGGFTTKNITVSIFNESKPEIISSQLLIQVGESDRIAKNLKDFFVQKNDRSYVIGNISYNGCVGNLPVGFDPATIMTRNGDQFVFDPQAMLELLAKGETLTLNFSVVVSTVGYTNCESVVNFSLVFIGENDTPTWKPGNTQDVSASQPETIDWRQFVEDIDRNANLSVQKINDMEFDSEGKVATSYGVFQYNFVTKTLTLTPSQNYDGMTEGATASFKIALTVADEHDAAITGDISFIVTGTNKAPTVKDAQFTVPENNILEIELDGRVEDVNTEDSHRIYEISVNGQTVKLNDSNKTITLDNGVTVTLDSEGGKIIVDASNRNQYPVDGKPEHFEILIKATDERNQNAVSVGYGTWSVVIDTKAPIVADLDLGNISEDEIGKRESVDLNKQVFDANIPKRNENDDWYAISGLQLTEAWLNGQRWNLDNLKTVFWSLDNAGMLNFAAADGYFDFLAQGETLRLVFSYTVTDNSLKDANGTSLSSEGKLSLTIDGVNDAPVIGESPTRYKLTNSGLDSGISISIGSGFSFTDKDIVDTGHRWSLSGVQGKKGETSIETVDLPQFSIDETTGLISVVNSNLDLLPGESATFVFEIIITDPNGGTDRKEITVTIFGKKEPIVEVDNLGGAENPILENGTGKTSTEIKVTDPSEDFMEQRDSKTWYAEPTFNVGLSDSSIQYASNLENISYNNLLEIVRDEKTGKYSLNFVGSKEQFAFLKQGETLTFDISVFVFDKDFKVVGTTTLTCTITGIGDLHDVVSKNNALELWANELDNDSIEYDPRYGIEDLDAGENYTYSLDTENLPPGFDLTWITVDPNTGQISLNRSDFKGITENTDFVFHIIVTGNTDLLENSVALTLNVRVAESPVAETIETKISESGSVGQNISITKPEDGATRDDDWYTVDTDAVPTLNGNSEKVAVSQELLDGLNGRIENGVFLFDPGDAFAYLSLGEWAELKFEFTVTDNKFGTTSTLTVLVKIEGENTSPVVSDIEKNAGQANGNIVELGPVSNWATDQDVNDSLTLVSIGGITVVNDVWFAVADQGEFKYDSATGILWYRSTGSELDAIQHGIVKVFNFELIFKDDSGDVLTEQGAGTLSISVTGINKRPEIIKDHTDLGNVWEGDKIECDASDFASDVNTGDSDRMTFHSINGQAVSDGDVLYLSDGTKITVKNGGKTIEIDTASRKHNMQEGESDARSFNVVLNDGSGAENALSETASIKLDILGKNDPPVMKNQQFVIGISDNPGTFVSVGTIDFSDPDTSKDLYRFYTVSNAHSASFILDPNDGSLIFWNKSILSGMQSNEEKTYMFNVFVETEEGERAEATITVTFIRKEAPAVTATDDGVLQTTEGDKTTSSIGFTVSDKTGENRHLDGDDWYEIGNIRFVGGKVSDASGKQLESFSSLPYGVVYKIDENGNFIFNQYQSFDGRGAFAFLGTGEKAILTFEVVVQDAQYGVQSTVLLTVIINGENSKPEAKNSEGKVIIRVDSVSGIKYYLSDLASDPDVRDTLSITHINDDQIVLNGSGIDIVEDGVVIGTVTLRKDAEKGLYLHFVPDGNFFAIRHDFVKEISFRFTVSDGMDSDTATLKQGIRGVNKAPEFKDDIDLKTNEKNRLVIEAEDLADDPNGDPIRIAAVSIDGNIYEFGYGGVITLPSGATIRFDEHGRLVYDPTTRNDNLKRNEEAFERFYVLIEDDLELGTSRSDWREMVLTVVGVNDEPVGNLPADNVITGKLGETVYINLEEHFSDPDGDSLLFFLENGQQLVDQIGSLSFVESVSIQEIGGKLHLVVLFKPTSTYSKDLDYTPIDLTLVAKDGADDQSATIRRTITIRTEPTARLEVESNFKSVDVGDVYKLTVTGKDLLNQLITGSTLSHGLYNITFAVYFNPDHCEIDENSIRCAFGDAVLMDDCIFVTIDGSKFKTENRFDVELLSFNVKATKAGTAAFHIDSIEMTRNDSEQIIHRSQIDKGSLSVHQVDKNAVGNSFVVGFSAPNVAIAYSQLIAMNNWSAEMELMHGNNVREKNDTDLIDRLFADEEFSFGTNETDKDGDVDDFLLGDGLENILDDLVGIF